MFIDAVYTWTEFNETIRSEFNKYKANNNITELNSDTYYDATDKFTWNYSSVGPKLAVGEDCNQPILIQIDPTHILGRC